MSYEKILTKAKSKYNDAIRGRDYQMYLIDNKKYNSVDELLILDNRRKIFQDRIYILTSIFGSKLLDGK